MRIERRKPERELVNITPLIDVVFILLVFFMLAGAIEPSEPFPLAPAASSSEIRGDVQDFVVLVDADGQIALDDQVLTRETLADAVNQALVAKPGALIQLKPDGGADAVEVIEIMEEIRDAGAGYIVLLTVGRASVEDGS
ncbi:MAG: biopolymer transporter ExbD [Pseudomonadota bacterium]